MSNAVRAAIASKCRPAEAEDVATTEAEQPCHPPIPFMKSSTFPPTKQQEQQRDQQQLQSKQPAGCPPYGSKSVIGRRAKMEDAFMAVPFLLDVSIADTVAELVPPRIAPQLRSISNSSKSSETAAAAALEAIQKVGSGDSVKYPDTSTHSHRGEGNLSVESLHFFGVFDGHGGAEAALHCARTLHERVKQVLTSLTCATGAVAENEADAEPEASSSSPDPTADVSQSSGISSFLDVEIEESQAAEEEPHKVEGLQCTSETFEAALTKAFHLTDEEFGNLGGYEHLALVGTTAVVALIGTRMIYVANCGDSRAVLLRDSQALALTDDHKAAREDETARVEAAGGQILFWNGVRVMGLLAVSRAIGDHSLRPYVIAQPEVTIVNRSPGDELLVMASDGLWDVMSNEEACALAKKCLTRAQQRGSSRQSAARVAATVLTRAAVDRGSRDNVTVVIVDLSSVAEDADGTTVGTEQGPSSAVTQENAQVGAHSPVGPQHSA